MLSLSILIKVITKSRYQTNCHYIIKNDISLNEYPSKASESWSNTSLLCLFPRFFNFLKNCGSLGKGKGTSISCRNKIPVGAVAISDFAIDIVTYTSNVPK